MWWFLVVFVVALAIVFIMPTPKSGRKAAGLDEFQAPTAEDGREIAVLFGTRDLNGPNVVWYGDLKTKAVKSSGGKK